MKTIRNILQIARNGTRLTDDRGRQVQLSLVLGTSVVLEFDLRGKPNTYGGTLSPFPVDGFGANEYYFAIDEKPGNSDSPALLRITGITVETDNNGCNLFRVEIPNTASPEIVACLGKQDSAEFFGEIGGINADGIAVFAWRFNITVLSRVYGGGGEETAANDPEYLKAVEVKAMLPTLTVEQTENGAVITTTDKNGTQVAEVKGVPGEKGEKGDKGDKGDKGEKGDKGDPGESEVSYQDFHEVREKADTAWNTLIGLQNRVYSVEETANAANVDALEAYNRSVEVEQNLGIVENTAKNALNTANTALATAQNAVQKMTPVDMLDYDPDGIGQQVVDIHLEGNKYYFQNEEAGDSIRDGLSVASVEQTLSEIIMRFKYISGGVSFPDTLQWIGTPSFESGKIYVISIINNVAVAGVIE